jgi:hypothetical protein
MQQAGSVVLMVNGHKKEYSQASEVEEYLYAQEQNWKWLTKLLEQCKASGDSLYMAYFASRINSVREELNAGINRIKLGTEKCHSLRLIVMKVT